VRILGVDPGLVATGYGVVDASQPAATLLEAGVIRTSAADPLEHRALRIYSEIRAVIEEFEPEVMAVEELYSHYSHPMTAVLMGHARGVVYLAAAERQVEVVSYAATRLKKALTGSGRAGKDQIRRMVQRLLCIGGRLEPDHVTDALAAALCHANVAARPEQRLA
jgi:crossover junction endodeoxyribonuclease RuvC